MEHAVRHFKLKKSRSSSRVKWLNRETIYEGKLLSMTGRTVRLFAPNPADERPYLDISYDWLVPVL